MEKAGQLLPCPAGIGLPKRVAVLIWLKLIFRAAFATYITRPGAVYQLKIFIGATLTKRHNLILIIVIKINHYTLLCYKSVEIW
jgi:hypothetical protein